MTDDLRQRIADALTAAAHQCDGNCGLDERACYDAHPITWSAMAAWNHPHRRVGHRHRRRRPRSRAARAGPAAVRATQL